MVFFEDKFPGIEDSGYVSPPDLHTNLLLDDWLLHVSLQTSEPQPTPSPIATTNNPPPISSTSSPPQTPPSTPTNPYPSSTTPNPNPIPTEKHQPTPSPTSPSSSPTADND